MDSKCLDRPSFSNKKCELYDSATYDFVLNTFLSSIENCALDADQELLYLNNLREAFEMHHRKAVTNCYVCEGTANMLKLFLNDDAWYSMVNYFQRKKEKYVIFAASRTMSATMYNFTQSIFQHRLSLLVENILKTPAFVSTANSLELLISLLDYSSKITRNGNDCNCVNTIACVVSSPEAIFSGLCVTLSLYWNSLVENFCTVGNPNVTIFLQLWKFLSEKNLSEKLSSVFLNEKFAVDFLQNAFKLPFGALRIYVDIIAQTFCSSLKSGAWNSSKKNVLEVIEISAISGGCLSLIPAWEVSLTFCTTHNRDQMSRCQPTRLNVISKKVIFIIFNLLAELTITVSLCEALDKVFEFISIQDDSWKLGYTYCWLIDSFIEYDDLLFGIMFSSLRIYRKLKERDHRLEPWNTSVDLYIKEFNPHKVFIKFLQQIGFDHNELLSFLLSDETCCLLYLLWYLKLLLTEWTSFVESHEFLFSEKSKQEFIFKNDLTNSPKDMSSKIKYSSQKCSLYVKSKNLVSYSISSSSDEEQDIVLKDSNKEEIEGFLKQTASTTLSILVNLKEGIQKLVDIKEFPYNIQPLLNLLRTCSDKCILLT